MFAVFLHLSMFACNVFNNRILEAKHLHLPNYSQLPSQTVNFFSPAHLNFLLEILFRFPNPYKIVFFQLISNQKDLLSNCIKV